MLLLAVSLFTAILLVASTFQATYSKSPWTKKGWFKLGTVALSIAAAILMVISAWLQDRSQAKLEAAVAGVSPIVFPSDLALEIQTAYDYEPAKRGLLDDAQLVVTVIPRSSGEFCKWGVTHTPTEDSAVGRIFPRMIPAPQGELPPGTGDPAVQVFKFDLKTIFTNGRTHVAGAPAPVFPIKMTRNMALDEYMQSQFVGQLWAPGSIRNVEFANLKIKGKSVPLYLYENGDGWAGSTVFRPTWERYCRSRSGP